MEDRGPNPDLWMATAGPRQPLKGVFYTQNFLSQIFALLTVILKHLLLANCVIVDQAVVQLNCSAHSSVANPSYNEYIKSNLKIYQIYIYNKNVQFSMPFCCFT